MLLCLHPSAWPEQPEAALVRRYLEGANAVQRKKLLVELQQLKLPFVRYEQAVAAPGPRGALSSGNRFVSFEFLGKQGRGEYSLHVPAGYDPARPWPLILALHGTDGNGRGYLGGWTRGFGEQYLIAAPTADRRHGLGGTTQAYRFALAVLADVQRAGHVDPDRVYAGGFSMGAHFSYQLGCHMAERFAAVVPRSGSAHRIVTYQYHPNFRNTGIYAVNGMADRMVPIALARKAPEAIRALGYDVVHRVLAGGHGHFPGEDPAIAEYLGKHLRPRDPRQVTKVVRRVTLGKRAWWVRIDELARNRFPIGMRLKSRSGQVLETFDLHREACRVDARIAGNTVTVQTAHVARFTLYLNDRLLDLDRPVRIVVNGRARHDRRFPRSLETLLETCRERGARDLLYSVAIPLRP